MPDSLHFSSSINIPLARERAEKFVNLCLYWDKQSLESRQHAGKYYNAGHTPKNFKFGDLVWLFARNIRTCRLSKKLDYKFHGLFRILKCIGTKAYQLDIPEVLKNIHDVFCVSHLEPYRIVKRRKSEPPPFINVDAEDQAEIEEVLDSKMHNRKLMYLVKWLGVELCVFLIYLSELLQLNWETKVFYRHLNQCHR